MTLTFWSRLEWYVKFHMTRSRISSASLQASSSRTLNRTEWSRLRLYNSLSIHDGDRRVNRLTAMIWSSTVYAVQCISPLRRYGHLKIFQDGGRRHLGFVRTGNSAIRSAVPINHSDGNCVVICVSRSHVCLAIVCRQEIDSCLGNSDTYRFPPVPCLNTSINGRQLACISEKRAVR